MQSWLPSIVSGNTKLRVRISGVCEIFRIKILIQIYVLDTKFKFALQNSNRKYIRVYEVL